MKVLAILWFALRVFKYIWRCESGRWFIFRDAPQDIVDYFAQEFVARPGDAGDQRLVREALDENRLRAWQRRSREAGEFHGS